MTNGFELGDCYGATIERIKAQDGDRSRLGMGSLMWISHAERPLRADELCNALAIELGSKDFNSSNIPSISTLVSCCLRLITVDKDESTVRQIHFTLQEYLSGHPDIFSRPHSAMAEICLTYLNSEQVKALTGDPSPDIRNMPFLEYCSLYWGAHAKRELSDCSRSLALELLQEYDNHISSKFIFEKLGYIIRRDFGNKLQLSGLHRASFSGITWVVTGLIELGYYDINEKDILGFTPLAWAAHNGHDETVRILLEWEGIKSEEPDNSGQKPLSFAAQNGHEGVVRIFLGREEVDPGKPDSDRDGQTPLSHAARCGREGVVQILLDQQDVNPDRGDNYGQTPLSHAARCGCEAVVKILLGREEVNPDKQDTEGRTPLSHAAQAGREGVVKILLGREDVNPNNPDIHGRTPLWYAASNGCEGVVKMLLAQGEVNPDKPDSEGQTPLMFATKYRHQSVVTLLHPHEAIAHNTF